MTWRCEICWFSGEEDVFYKEDVDDMIEMLEEVYQGGQVKEESYHQLMEIFNTPICPECGSKHSIEFMDDSDEHLHADHDLIQAEIDAEQAREMAELSGDDDPEMLDLLYADGIIDEYEWWERKHG